ncbi:pyridoxamine 5'-phosphate oxidase [Wilcoxina mikolae CBS 423.85]|nr:pyridoxamine 5'-phosphate oxidase [Wilcoxina mikolae CBS 423.85]
MALYNSSSSSPSTATSGDPATSDKLIFAPPNSQFSKSTLESTDLSPSPFTQFHTWFSSAVSSGVPSPETTVLSTASLPSGRVSARIVYLKELSPTGFILYSNFGTSRKAADLRTNSWAALTFSWREQERQVRVEGVTERLSVEESQVYFNTRIRGSKVGAWASEQSSVLKDREELESRVKEVEEWFRDVEEIPVPTFWGGLRIRPVLVEFWQGRESRLHDRFVYTRENVESEEWKVERLSP